MRNPLLVDPQTKMPVYFDDEGKSPLDKILGGDGDKQIEALWHFVRQAAASKRSAKPVVGAPP